MSWGGGEGGSHQWELVGHAPVGGDLGTEAERREHLVAVVVLDDLTHRPQRHGVGVELVGAQVVQGGGLRWVACSRGFGGGSVCGVVAHPPPRAWPQGGSCPLPALTIGRSEVDGHREIDLGPGREKNPSEDGEMEEELHSPHTSRFHAGDAPQPTGPTLGAPPGPPSPAAPLHGREHHSSPAPDVVQERVVRLHSEGQQGHLWGQQGEQDGSHAPCPVPTSPHRPRVQVLLLLHLLPGVHHLWEGRGCGALQDGAPRGAGGGLSHPWVIPGGAAWSPWGL